MLTVRGLSKIKQFQRILTFYAKDKKDTTQNKKATTQDKKDILRRKGTKQGHSGQKGEKGTFLTLCFFSWARVESRVEFARAVSRFPSMEPSRFYGLLTFP